MMSDVLSRHGVPVRYVSIDRWARGHDSSAFHFGGARPDWDLTDRFAGTFISPARLIAVLEGLRREFGITHCFATGSQSFLLAAAGYRYNYWSYGGDVCQIPRLGKLPHNPLRPREWAGKARQLLDRRRVLKSIAAADAVQIAPYQWPILHELIPGKPLFFLPHMLKAVAPEDIALKKKRAREVLTRRYAARHFFFSSTRHFWRYYGGNDMADGNNKGNDVVLRAFSLYSARPGTEDDRLVLVRKGPDVGASIDLVRQLGLQDRVIWVAEVGREELGDHYLAASACLGQFATPVLTYTALEPLAFGTPSVSGYTHAHSADVPFYAGGVPVFDSNDPPAIADHLYALTHDEAKARETGDAGLRWVNENCSESNFVRSFLACFDPQRSFIS